MGFDKHDGINLNEELHSKLQLNSLKLNVYGFAQITVWILSIHCIRCGRYKNQWVMSSLYLS